MNIHLGLLVIALSLSISTCLECKLALSEKHCARLHRRHEELYKAYKTAENRKHVNPTAYSALHRELARVASLIGHEVPGSNKEEAEKYAAMYSSVDSDSYGDKYARMPTEHDFMAKDEYAEKYSNIEGEADGHAKEKPGYEHDNGHGNKKCNDAVSKERCDELFGQYEILKELYMNKTTKAMLDLDAYNDLHRDLTEAGIHVEEKPVHEEHQHSKKTCDESVPKEECDALLKKYKIMKEMYNDADLKTMLDPEAYSALHREMAEAGITVGKKTPHGKGEYKDMSCDESVPKETCDSLLKQYKVMKEMYNDADLKDMLNPDAYSDLKRNMEDAGLHHAESSENDKYDGLKCDEAISKETCHNLIKKYKAMKEMYNDADLKQMLNPNAYSDLMREMTEAGIHVGDHAKKEHTHAGMSCDKSVPKQKCDALLKKYKVMKEMYNDADLKSMLNPEGYSDLEREMQEAGIDVKARKGSDCHN